MRIRTAVWFLALFAARTLAQSADTGTWRVTLLKPPGCSACSLVEESLKRKGNPQRVALADGRGGEVTATVERRQGATLTEEEWQQVLALPYFDKSQWQRQASERAAQVLLKLDGRVVAAGNIADSADLRSVAFPDDLTLPLVPGSVESVRAGYSSYFSSLFLRSWNLDWFYRLARDPALASSRHMDAWMAQRSPAPVAPLQAVNVVLMSTGNGAVDNPIFNAIRSEEIQQVLTGEFGVTPAQLRVFHGSGEQRGFNAVEQTRGALRFVRRDLPGAQPFRLQSLTDIFEQARRQAPTRNLFVLIGHGGPDGAPMWGQPAALGPEELQTLHRHGNSDDVLVSGNCFGGVLAQAMSCGFFGARPDTVATGCQADAAEVAQSKDYLHVFFSVLSKARRHQVDADGNGQVSFDEAHWYATQYGDERNITYSTVDALAEDYFGQHPDALPAELPLSDVRQLATGAPAAERAALQTLSAGLDASYRIPMYDLAAQGARWTDQPQGPRPMLGQLSRRLLYTQRFGKGTASLTRAQDCGSRALDSFLTQ